MHLVAITGTESAIASQTTSGYPSVMEDEIKTLALEMYGYGFLTNPTKDTYW